MTKPETSSNAPILPGTKESPLTGESLTRVIAIMCFLASLALGAFLAIGKATDSWTQGLADSVTVQIKPSKEMTSADQLTTALNLLTATEGVEAANPLSRKESQALLEPWLGKNKFLLDLPIPQLIEVQIQPGGIVNLEALGRRLAQQVPGAQLDDHRRWNDRLVKFAGSLKGLSFTILLLIVFATVMIIVFATRADMSASRDIVEVLHLIGAKDEFIALQFQWHFFWIALWAGFMGIGGAAIAFFFLGQAARRDWAGPTGDILPTLAFDPSFYVFLLLIPVMTVIVCVATARFAVLHTLRNTL